MSWNFQTTFDERALWKNWGYDESKKCENTQTILSFWKMHFLCTWGIRKNTFGKENRYDLILNLIKTRSHIKYFKAKKDYKLSKYVNLQH